MKDYQLCLLTSNMMIGLSFLSSGFDRAGLIILGILWFIGFIIMGDGA